MGVVMKLRAAQAYTRHPNTPETDAMTHVEHVVVVAGGMNNELFKVTLMATDPMDAIEKINRMEDEAIRKLPRIDE